MIYYFFYKRDIYIFKQNYDVDGIYLWNWGLKGIGVNGRDGWGGRIQFPALFLIPGIILHFSDYWISVQTHHSGKSIYFQVN
jgi:hypothetical protein